MFDELFSCAVSNGLNLYNLTVIENGKAQTGTVTPSGKCADCYSIAKVFTATSIMILYDRGLLDDDALFYEIMREEFDSVRHDPRWERVKISDLMTHRAGFGDDHLDIDSNECYLDYPDFFKAVISRPLVTEPSLVSRYTDAAFYLLSRVVSKVSGRKLDDFVRDEIGKPTHMKELAWSKCPDGYPIGATGLYINSSDIAAMGALWLGRGSFDGNRIFSERTAEHALTRGYELHRFGGSAYAKGGMYGQLLWFNPQKNTVAAWTGCDLNERNSVLTDLLGSEYSN